MRPLAAIIARDLKLAARQGGDVLTLILFFVMIAAIVPFAIGPDRVQLARLAPGIVWIAGFLAMLLGLDRLFRADAEDGTLQLYRHAAIPLEVIVFGKLIAHWLLSALPLIVASPLLALILSLESSAWLDTVIALLLGTPALTALGTFGAAVTVSLRRGGLIGPVLIIPLSIPILIFGVGAIGTESTSPLLFLAAISLVAVAFSPFAAALALRQAED